MPTGHTAERGGGEKYSRSGRGKAEKNVCKALTTRLSLQFLLSNQKIARTLESTQKAITPTCR